MALNEETTLLFDSYLENELSEVEKRAFEDRLAEDTELAADFATYQDMHVYLENEFSEERKEFTSTLKNISDGYTLPAGEVGSEITTTGPKAKVFPFKPWQLGIAASIMLALGVVFFSQNSGLDYTDYQFQERISLGERGDTDAILKEAEVLFNAEEYGQAIAKFDELLNEYPNNAEVQFYKAVAHDAINEFDEANELFSELSRGGSAYRNKALFYSAVSYWKQDNVEKSKRLLNDIPKSASEYKKAQRLLKKL